jgi:hypothetical protein
VRHSAAESPESKSLSPASPESHKTYIHSADPSSRSAPSPAACTQTAPPDRSTYTACTNAIRTRISDTARWPSSPAGQSHIAYTVKPCASPVDSPVADQTCCPASAGPLQTSPQTSLRTLYVRRGRDPDTHAADISPQTPPQARGPYCLPTMPCPASARDESRVGIHNHRGHRETQGEHQPLCNPVSPVVKI